MEESKTVIFWGAGATASLGMRTTEAQGKFIKCLTGADNHKNKEQKPLEERIAVALDSNKNEQWHDAFYDLLTILGDDPENEDTINDISEKQLNVMSRNWWQGASKQELKNRIIHLRLVYDWPALKSIVCICPGVLTDTFKINDLFNILDMHIPSGSGFRTPYSGKQYSVQEDFLDARRLIGAKNALRMILGGLFYVDWQKCISSKSAILNQYKDFALHFGRRMQRDGITLAREQKLDDSKFYQGDISFVSLNYDPIALWIQFIANRELNKSPNVRHIDSPATPLNLFHNFGHLIPARHIGRDRNKPLLWYPMNEAVAQRINKATVSDYRVRLTKFLFPHGCLCWRECPDCGKLSAYHGDEWNIASYGLFPPPPLKAFDKNICPDWLNAPEKESREDGNVDARECLHCGTLTYAENTQTVMQSSFKSQPPSFIEEIQRDLRATAMQANHIIFMGYSLPPDDVTYRAFFSARRRRIEEKNNEGKEVHCTIVNFNENKKDWYKSDTLKKVKHIEVVKAACDIFGDKNVRFYGGGVPDVFLENSKVTDSALERLLNWDSQ